MNVVTFLYSTLYNLMLLIRFLNIVSFPSMCQVISCSTSLHSVVLTLSAGYLIHGIWDSSYGQHHLNTESAQEGLKHRNNILEAISCQFPNNLSEGECPGVKFCWSFFNNALKALSVNYCTWEIHNPIQPKLYNYQHWLQFIRQHAQTGKLLSFTKHTH